MNKKIYKRVLSFVLVLAMLCSLLGTAAFAEDSGPDPGSPTIEKVLEETGEGGGSDLSTPDGDDLEAEDPDAEDPDGEDPDAEDPDGEDSDAEDPDGEDPDADDPDAEDPDAEDPDAEDPDAEDPDADDSDSDDSDADDSDVDGSDVNEPDTQEPDLGDSNENDSPDKEENTDNNEGEDLVDPSKQDEALLAVMEAAAFALTAVSSDDAAYEWYSGTSGSTYTIQTAADLRGFANIVNGTAENIPQDSFSGKTVQLANNIKLADDGLYIAKDGVQYGTNSYPIVTTQYVLDPDAPVWTPIGSGEATTNTNATTNNAFAGTFDGRGFTISGVYTGTKDAASGNTDTVQGLFGVVTGTIQNVTVSGCITAKMVAGGIVAHLDGGTVTNCINNAIVFVDGGTTPAGGVENGGSRVGANGGIAGNVMSGSSVTDCVNNAQITCANSCYGGRTGGIIGLIDSSTAVVEIARNRNNGDIDAYQLAGGIVGLNYSACAIIDQCCNTGEITGYSPGSTYVGGITAETHSDIISCYNKGDFSVINAGKSAHMGGIVSELKDSATIVNCYNTGDCLTKGSSYGSICGTGYDSPAIMLINCYTFVNMGEDLTNLAGKGGLVYQQGGIDAAFITALCGDGRAFIADSSSINGGYPILRWQAGEDTATVTELTTTGAFQTEYVEGQTFDADTLVVWANYSDGTRETVRDYTISVGSSRVSSDYLFQMEDNGKTLTYSVSYKGQTCSREGTIVMTVNTPQEIYNTLSIPSSLLYQVGDKIDCSGLTTSVSFTNGTMSYGVKLTDEHLTINLSEPLTADDNGKTLELMYTLNGVTARKELGTIEIVPAVAKDTDGVYQISTVDDMRAFAAETARGVVVSGKLKNDIDLSNLNWTPIGATSTTAFQGTFDGNGKTLTLQIDSVSSYQGLFAYTNGCTIKDLTVAGSVKGGQYTAAIVARLAGGGVIDNCVNKAAVTGTNYYVGGITGSVYSTGGTIQNCVNQGAVTSSSYHVGGIVGYMMTGGTVSGCLNQGTVTSASASTTATYSVGGVVGDLYGAGVIENCINTGSVTTGGPSAGGIAGVVYNAGSIIRNCYNTGDISGSSASTRLGGVAGYAYNASSTIQNCYNTGSVTNTGGGTDAYGIGCLRVAMVNVSNVYALEGTASSATNQEGCGELKTSDAMKAADFVSALNGVDGTAWKADGATPVNGGYPVLSWQDTSAPEDPKYTVTVNAAVNGTVEASVTEAAEGSFVTLTITPASGYRLDTLSVTDGDGASVHVSGSGFAMPASNVTIDASFVLSDRTSWYDPAGTEFTITTAEELAELAAIVNGTSQNFAQDSFQGKTVTLGADIDLVGYPNWTPIGTVTVTGTGTYTLGDAFEGVFDGGDKTIDGLSAFSELGGVALFGYSTGTIRDLTVSGTVEGHDLTAGLVAAGSGSLENIVSHVTVTASGNCVGGIVGSAAGDLTITGCHNTAEIRTAAESSEKSTGRIAGIIGCAETGYRVSIRECSNTGNITGYQYVGGIIGGSFGNVEIDACFNAGNLTGDSFGKVYLGGIAGKLEGGTISNCYNLGRLYDLHWSDGHIRAVGGIAGCEENHAVGTAITNCFNVGVIELNTSNMTLGSKFIYMTGNISGGNSSTGQNTMRYENCFYLEGSIPVQDPAHPDYPYWSDVFKNDPLAYDTDCITKCTAEELKSSEVLEALGGSFQASPEDGWPILYWQTDSAQPAPVSYVVTSSVIGGTAAVQAEPTAYSGDTVTVVVSGVESGKQIKSVVVIDASGAAVSVTGSDGTYRFQMPARAVTITVTLENTVAEGAKRYAVTLPTGLDAIWTLRMDSTYLQDGLVPAGATVAVIVEKQQGAVTTSFSGVSVRQGGTDAAVTAANEKTFGGAKWYGEYSFTMPEGDVSVTLNELYSDFKVYSKTSSGTELKNTYTRAEMTALGKDNAVTYYSGWESETQPFIGKAEKYVTLEQLLTGSGLSFESGDSLTVTAADGFSQTYKYEDLIGTARYYYADILSNRTDAADKTAFAPIFTIVTNLTSDADEVERMTCDTLNTYRFVYGQSEAELTGSVKIVDAMPKAIVSLTLVKAGSSGGGGGVVPAPDTSGMDLSSTTWDGTSIDVSWYFNDPDNGLYTIRTAAEFAGVAALVNGLVNEDCKIYTGSEVCTAASWNSNSQYVFSGSGSTGIFSESTADYSCGIEDFNGVTICLAADLNMSAGNYMPIGGQYLMTDEDTSTKVGGSFCGVLDGSGHSVTIVCDRHCSGNFGDGASIGLIGRLGVHDDEPEDVRPSGAAVCNVAVYGSVRGNRSVGGIVGKIGKTNGGATIENCANFASITGTDSKGTGGICGAAWNGGTIFNCYNAGTVTNVGQPAVAGIAGSNEIAIVNCYNIGKVTGPTGHQSAAIASENGGGSYENCYWLTGSADVGVFNVESDQVGEKTEDEMKTEAFLTALGPAFAKDAQNINKGYPVLTWQVASSSSGGGGGSGQPVEPVKPGEVMETNVPAATTVKNGEATITLDSEQLSKELESAGANTQIVIKAEIPEGEEIDKAVTILTRGDMSDIAQAEASLKVSTPLADVTLSNKALQHVAGTAGQKDEKVTITAATTENGTHIEVAVNGEAMDQVDGGLLVTLSAAGQKLSVGSVMVLVDAEGGETVIKRSTVGTDGVTALLSGSCTVKVVDNAKSFQDVSGGAWYADAVAFVSAHELFSGAGNGMFDPNGDMTRAMLVTVLHRLEDTPNTTAVAVFGDVPAGTWYTDAVAWASENGIVTGTGEGFDPDGSITREQLATILYRYANVLGLDVSASEELSAFADGSATSVWAAEAMEWAVGSGLINGKDGGVLDPSGSATRAEVAAILQRMMDLIVQ